MEFDGITLRGSTRNGSTLEVSEDIHTLIESLRLWEEGHYDYSLDTLKGTRETPYKESWEYLFASKASGFIQSRLYQHKWNLDYLMQDFRFHFESGSWVSKNIDKANGPWRELTIHNAGSYAARSLYDTLRLNSGMRRPKSLHRILLYNRKKSTYH